jgi:hypothetical protein
MFANNQRVLGADRKLSLISSEWRRGAHALKAPSPQAGLGLGFSEGLG